MILFWFLFYLCGHFSFAILFLYQPLTVEIHKALLLEPSLFLILYFSRMSNSDSWPQLIVFFPPNYLYTYISHLYLQTCIPIYLLNSSSQQSVQSPRLTYLSSSPLYKGPMTSGSLIPWQPLSLPPSPPPCTHIHKDGNYPPASPIQSWLQGPETLFLTTYIQYL